MLDHSMLAVVQAVESVAANPLPLFGVGLGWSLSFDTATMELAVLTVEPMIISLELAPMDE